MVCWVHTIELGHLSTTLWMTGRWAGLAHAPQVYCFSPFLDVLSMFKVYSLNY